MAEIIHVVAGEIVKANRRDDGTVEFLASKAAGPELDIDQQKLDSKWLAREMPEWFETGGNLREMHQPIAAGVATEMEERPDGFYIAGEVVDPGSASKVEKGILKALSVGIKGHRLVKDASAPGGRVVGGKIVEVSLVDRPANSLCKLTLAKAAGPQIRKTEELVESGEAELTPEPQPYAPNTPETLRAGIAKVAGAPDAAAALSHLSHRDASLATKAATPDQAVNLNIAMQNIAALISSEAAEMAATGSDEISDLRLLLDAASALKWFSLAEANEPSEEDDMTELTLAAVIDAAKNATTEELESLSKLMAPLGAPGVAPGNDAEEPPGAPGTGVDSATDPGATTAAAPISKTDIIDAVKAALAESSKGYEARLAEVEKMAAPGGPVRTRSPQDATKAAASDSKATAAYYRQQAAQVADPKLAAGYRQMAAEAEAKA
ncbi:MAG: hypothetical protein M3003_00870 [Candidatus Dormibacteraeota bacterium]|nr:hypothetical protein [Candidatus Dormibacteraeota bacterium]